MIKSPSFERLYSSGGYIICGQCATSMGNKYRKRIPEEKKRRSDISTYESLPSDDILPRGAFVAKVAKAKRRMGEEEKSN